MSWTIRTKLQLIEEVESLKIKNEELKRQNENLQACLSELYKLNSRLALGPDLSRTNTGKILEEIKNLTREIVDLKIHIKHGG